MDSISVFIGTDATENWNNIAFKEFSKPYFERGNAWSFESVDRNIFISENIRLKLWIITLFVDIYNQGTEILIVPLYLNRIY